MSDNKEVKPSSIYSKDMWVKVLEVASNCGVSSEELAAAITYTCRPNKKAIKELKKYGVVIDG